MVNPILNYFWMVAFTKMLVYEQIDVSDVVDINNSKECMVCHYWYYLEKDFTYGPYLCTDATI